MDNVVVEVQLIELTEKKEQDSACRFDKPVDFFTDVIFCIGNEEVHCNRQFMAFISPVFKSMLFGEYSEGNKDRIELKEINADDFKNMLNVVYPDHRPITQKTVHGILTVAHMYQIKSVIDKCEEFLSTSLNQQFPKLILLADKYALPSLMEKCIAIAQNHEKAAEVVNNKLYSYLSLQTKDKMLKNIFHGRRVKSITHREVNDDVNYDY